MKDNSTLQQAKFNFQYLLKLLIYYRGIIYTIVGLTVLGLIIYTFVVPKKYEAEAKLLPSTARSPSFNAVSGLLGGLDIGALNQGEDISSYFFPDILKSNTILKKLVETEFEYQIKSQPRKQTLVEYYQTDSWEVAVERLRGNLEVDSEFETGIVTIKFTHRSPELASKVVNTLIDYLNWFNNYKLKTKATENLEYINKRLEMVQEELSDAEDAVKQFKQKNRNYNISSSPELQLQLERLEREKDVKASIYQTLMQQRETERLKVKKEVPIVNVLSYASPPYYKSFPKRKLIVIGGFLISLALSIWFILILSIVRDNEKEIETIKLNYILYYLYQDLHRLPFVKK